MISIWVIAVALVVILTLLFYFSWSISLGVYLRSVCSNRAKRECVALTFDDGVDCELTPKLLDLLDRYGAKGSFFIIGSKGGECPEIVRMIHERGHSIGNHSMWHKGTFPMQWSGDIYAEIEECSTILSSIIGERVRYFRPPFGVTNPMIGSAVRRLGLTSIGWSVRSYDTMGHSAEVVVQRITKQIEGGDIVLMHDNRECVLEITEATLKYLQANGYRAVSIDELLQK